MADTEQVLIGINMPDTVHRALRLYAELNGISLAEVFRRSIDRLYEQVNPDGAAIVAAPPVRKTTVRVDTRYKEMLDALSTYFVTLPSNAASFAIKDFLEESGVFTGDSPILALFRHTGVKESE